MAQAQQQRHELSAVSELIAQAEQLRLNDNLVQALHLLEKAVALDPHSFDARLAHSMLLIDCRQFDAALHATSLLVTLAPQSAEAQNILAYSAMQLGKFALALAAYDAALALTPQSPELLGDRAVALLELQRYEEALASLDAAISLNPNAAIFHNNRGNALRALGQLAEALTSYGQAITLRPDYIAAYSNRGVAYTYLGNFRQAYADHARAIALQPDNPEFYCNAALALRGLEQFEQALTAYDQALSLAPQHAQALEGRAHMLLKLKRYADAIVVATNYMGLRPDALAAYTIAGFAQYCIGDYANAVDTYTRAIALDSRAANLYNDRAEAYVGLREFAAAHADYDQAITLDPGLASAYWNKSLCYLLTGDFAHGWPLYEWRWKTEPFRPLYRTYPKPLWLGAESIQGKRLFIYPEQGLGDFIQACRYIPLLEAMGAQVVLETHPSLLGLMRSLSTTVTLVSTGDTVAGFDLHCPIMSLPLALGTTLDRIPRAAHYLQATPQKIAQWQAHLGPKTAPRVGLVWSGSTAHGNDRNRSITLETLTPLLQLPCEFHCLQRELRAVDYSTMAVWGDRLRIHADDLHDFDDTAALISAMDIVVSVDTSVAHLAGALGKPVALLLPHQCDYRWLLAREDSPWYPSAKLFRHSREGTWEPVIAAVQQYIAALLEHEPRA